MSGFDFEGKDKCIFNKGNQVALVCCSNPLPLSRKENVELVKQELNKYGLIVQEDKNLYESNYVGAKRRAEILMDYYEDRSINFIFDVSGGDMANEILPYVNYEKVAQGHTFFCGYSDLTTVINSIYQQTKGISILYQITNIIHHENKMEDIRQIYDFKFDFIQGKAMEGIMVGGNTRCLLKLAGTKYFPDVNSKILFLEARSGGLPQITAYFSQLSQMGVFTKISGLLLGTFTELDSKHGLHFIEKLVHSFVPDDIPIVRTLEVGHGIDSKALFIGKYYYFYL